MKVGYQLYSSRNFGPMSETLKMLADTGYAQVEGYGGLFQELGSVQDLARALGETDLEMPSGHFGLDLIEKQPGRVIEIAWTLGLKNVFVPYLDASARPVDAAGWRAFGARLEAAGAQLMKAGLSFGWHNHDFEFVPLPDGTMPIQALLEGGPKLAFEFDVAWCARAGQDPLHWLTELWDRIVAVHVKDMAPKGENLDEDGWADVGDGTIDWKGLMPRLHEAGCDLFIMEHDNPSDDRRFAERSLAHVKTI